MDAVLLTKIIIFSVIIILGIYDVLIWLVVGAEATISRVSLQLSLDFPILLLGLGILLGHIFVYQVVYK